MKILHIAQMIGGLDVYIRNSITYSSGNIDYVIMHGIGGYTQSVCCRDKEVEHYSSAKKP